jgi:CubicO group peptidase (beta-lactamase class C family)
MNELIPFDEYSEKDFATELTLRQDSELNMRMFLAKTLSASLYELDSTKTVNELCENGNFQFRFYVDNKLIKEFNLPTGAGSASYKNSQTVYAIPLKRSDNIDHWGRFTWIKFMKKWGGEEALTAGKHNLKIEVRPYLEIDELKVGKIIATGAVTLNIVNKTATEEQIAIQEIQANSGWKVSKEKYNTEKIRALNEKIAQGKFIDITSLIVAKNGELLLEEYFNDTKRDDLRDTRSVGKSFASTMLGIAIEDGHIKNVDQKLSTFYNLKTFKNYSDKKANVTLKDLLTMSSSFEGDDSDMKSVGNEEYMYPTSDWVKFALDLPMQKTRKNAESWTYFTAGAVLIGDIIHHHVPSGLDAYSKKKLFDPLSITSYKWEYTPTNVANTAGGLQLRSLDLAKYGQVYKDDGIYMGKQIIPETWVKESLAKQIQRPEGNEHYYGYLFWNKNFVVDGKEYNVSYSAGNGGNYIYIFNDIPFVIVITATAYGQPYAHPQVDKMMENYILPSVLNID